MTSSRPPSSPQIVIGLAARLPNGDFEESEQGWMVIDVVIAYRRVIASRRERVLGEVVCPYAEKIGMPGDGGHC